MNEMKLEQLATRNGALGALFGIFISLTMHSFLAKLPFIKNEYFALLIISFILVPFFTIILQGDYQPKINFKAVVKYSVIGLVYALVFAFIGMLLVSLISLLFQGRTFGLPIILFMIPTVSMILAYLSTYIVKKISFPSVANLAIFSLVAGVSVSALLSEDPDWWMESVSYLGMPTTLNHYFVNIGLVLASLILIFLYTYFFEWLDELKNRKYISENKAKGGKFVYLYCSVALGLIGLFPYAKTEFSTMVHNFSAITMFPPLVFLMLLSQKFIKVLNKSVYRVGFIYGVIPIILYIAFMTGNFSLALLEIYSILIITIWLFLFIRNINLLLNEGNKK